MPQYEAYSHKNRPLLVLDKRGVFYTVVPLTTKINKNENKYHIYTTVNDSPALIMTEQIFSVTKKALGDYLGNVDIDTMFQIENSLNRNSIILSENRLLKNIIK